MRRRVLAKPLAVVAAPADTTAPTVPTNVTASSITATGFTLSWTASSDAVGVTGYVVQIDGVTYATPTGTSIGVAGRSASTTYAVRVQARDAAGNFSALSTAINVTTTVAAPVAAFTGTPVSGTIPLAVQFTSTSTGATSYAWTFGDGGTATTASPSHTFTTAGTYTVALTVTNAAGSNTQTRTGYVAATAVTSANFYTTQTPATGNANDGQAVVVGNKITSDIDGSITGVRAYRATTAPTSLIGLLYDNAGNELARATFSSPTAGWNTATFATPVAITAGTAYRVAYWSSGPYVFTGTTQLPIVNDHLTIADSFYAYNATPTMPTNSTTNGVGIGSLYFADVAFSYAGTLAAPGTPAAPAVTVGDASALVEWTAPAGGTPSGYDVQQFVGATGGAVTSVGNVLSATVTGLTNGTAYTFKVRAKNATGTSAYSAASSAATPVSAGVGNGGAAVAHGGDLTLNHVGPWTLQGVSKGSESLQALTVGGERISTYPGNARPSWIPGTAYVYNNSATNHGGIVPAGGLTIDGYAVPAGTWVVQFRNFDSSIIIEGDCGGAGSAFPGVMFRGCRMRGPWQAPGFISNNGQSTGGITWVTYSDAGGVSLAPANYCEIPFNSQGFGVNRDHQYLIRNYITNATTLAFGHNNGDAFIENWGEHISDFGDSSKHLNGFGNSGGETATLWLRNHVTTIQESGSTMATDIFQMAADNGAYPGTGSNLDGSTGYVIKDNFLGGAQYVLQLGVDKANTTANVQNVKVTGNKFTTTIYANGGSIGIAYKNPAWATLGNVWSGNTWADGANAGVTIAPPA